MLLNLPGRQVLPHHICTWVCFNNFILFAGTCKQLTWVSSGVDDTSRTVFRAGRNSVAMSSTPGGSEKAWADDLQAEGLMGAGAEGLMGEGATSMDEGDEDGSEDEPEERVNPDEETIRALMVEGFTYDQSALALGLNPGVDIDLDELDPNVETVSGCRYRAQDLSIRRRYERSIRARRVGKCICVVEKVLYRLSTSENVGLNRKEHRITPDHWARTVSNSVVTNTPCI